MMWGPGMMGGYYGGFGFLWMIIGFIFVIAIIIGVVLLIVWIVRRVGVPSEEMAKKSMAAEILKERYAKGEITKEKYEEMKKDLG